MKSRKPTHIYDLGKFQFNRSTDVDLLAYKEIHFGTPSCNKSTSFRVSRTTTVAEFSVPFHESVKLVVPHDNPRNATKALLEGLRITVETVNDQVQRISGSKKLQINPNKFDVVEYAKIETSSGDFDLYFPVEVKSALVTSTGSLEVSINFDNPTSLSLRNQENGCQGSHFGYTIIGGDGNRTRGHVLITTFMGFPSRDENFKLLPTESPSTKLLSFAKLCKAALGRKNLPFDITTGKGIDDNQVQYQSERTKQLPFELQLIHNTFSGKHFKLASKKNISQVCDR